MIPPIGKSRPVRDTLDRRVLFELDRDSRQSFAVLARKLKRSEETVRYRVERMRSEGVIRKFMTLVDSGKLGLGYYKVLLTLRNVGEREVEALTTFLVEQPEVNWLIRADNLFDVAFTVRVSRVNDFNLFIDELKSRYGRFIERLSLAINVWVEFLPRTWLVSNAMRRSTGAVYTTPKEILPVDEIDLILLTGLSGDARASAVSLAERARVTSETVAQRIRALERNGVIIRHTAALDVTTLGLQNFHLFVQLSHATETRLADFLKFCRSHPAVAYLVKSLGEWDYELSLEVSSVTEYRSVRMRLTREFGDIVKECTGTEVAEIAKLTLAPR